MVNINNEENEIRVDVNTGTQSTNISIGNKTNNSNVNATNNNAMYYSDLAKGYAENAKSSADRAKEIVDGIDEHVEDVKEDITEHGQNTLDDLVYLLRTEANNEKYLLDQKGEQYISVIDQNKETFERYYRETAESAHETARLYPDIQNWAAAVTQMESEVEENKIATEYAKDDAESARDDARASALLAQTYANNASEAINSAENAAASALSASQSASSAEYSLTQTSQYRNEAETFKNQASASATSASSSATSASTAESRARQWAESDNPIDSTHHSAKYYAEQAESSATNAEYYAGQADLCSETAGTILGQIRTLEASTQSAASAANSSKQSASDFAENSFNYMQQASQIAQDVNADKSLIEGYKNDAQNSMLLAEKWAIADELLTSSENTRDHSAKYYANKSKEYSENSKTSEDNAKDSEVNAKTSETNAATSASNAQTSAVNAQDSASNANTSEANAATHEANAQRYAQLAQEHLGDIIGTSKQTLPYLECVYEGSRWHVVSDEIANYFDGLTIIIKTPKQSPNDYIELNNLGQKTLRTRRGSGSIGRIPKGSIVLATFIGDNCYLSDVHIPQIEISRDILTSGTLPIAMTTNSMGENDTICTKSNNLMYDFANNVLISSGGFAVGSDKFRNTPVALTTDLVNLATKDELSVVDAIAKGKATGYVFDTVENMNEWVENNSDDLKLGDNLYIRATEVPDYWWDGTQVQELETQKVDLSEYAKTEDIPAVPTNVSEFNNDADYQNSTQVENAIISKGYQTAEEVNDAITEKGYITEINANATFATKAELEDVESSIPSIEGLATEQQLEEGLDTKQPVGDYATRTELSNGLATKQDNLTAGDGIALEENVISVKGFNNPIGSIIPVTCASGYIPQGYLPCDGSEYSSSQFNDLWVNYLTNNLLNTCTYTEYTSDISTYGQCGKFAIDTTNGTFKTPTIKDGSYITQALSDSELGKSYKESLPNITGELSFNTQTFAVTATDAFVGIGGQGSYASVGSTKGGSKGADFNASRSSSTYEDGAKVQGDNVRLRYFVCVADGEVNQSIMDWSAWATSLQGKANIDLQNVTQSYSKAIDGQWVVTDRIDVFTSTSIGNYTVSLSEILPDDEFGYELLFAFYGDTSNSTSGNNRNMQVYADENRTQLICAQIQDGTNQSIQLTQIVPLIKNNRNLYITLSGTSNAVWKSLSFTLLAYRRIGTNTDILPPAEENPGGGGGHGPGWYPDDDDVDLPF